MNRTVLLEQLKLEDEPKPRDRGRTALIAAGSVAVALLVAAAVWFFATAKAAPRVETATATEADMSAPSSVLEASGYLVARRQATVSSKITGRIVEVPIEEGQFVKAGEIIARLDGTNAQAALAQAIAQRKAAEASVKVAEAALAGALPRRDRDLKLQAVGALSQEALDTSVLAFETARTGLQLSKEQREQASANVDAYRLALADTIVRAPFDGVVVSRAAQPGEIVSPISAGGGFTRTGIGTIVDMDSLEVEVDVGEKFINLIRKDMTAVVHLNAYPDAAFPATVIGVVPIADRSKATVAVRASLTQKDARMVPGMSARITFLANRDGKARAANPAVLVPEQAISAEDGGQSVVFVVQNSQARRRPVSLGGAYQDRQLVTAGLRPGDVVVVSAGASLEDGMKVRTSK